MELGLAKQLKINQLRLISAIAEHGQLRLAADELSVTQPAASRILADIEQIIGDKLFERHPKGMELTPLGHAVAQRAHKLLVEFRDLARDVNEIKQGESGRTSVGAVMGAALRYAIPASRQLKTVAPKAEVNVSVDESEALVRDLIAGNSDFIIARLPAGFSVNDFDIYSAHTETIKLVVRKDHQLAKNDRVSVKELSSYEWVIQTHRALMWEAIKKTFITAGADMPKNITSSTSLLIMISILASSSAIAPMASEVVDLLIDQKVGTRLAVLPLEETIELFPYHLIQIKGRQLSPVANCLLNFITEGLEKDFLV